MALNDLGEERRSRARAAEVSTWACAHARQASLDAFELAHGGSDRLVWDQVPSRWSALDAGTTASRWPCSTAPSQPPAQKDSVAACYIALAFYDNPRSAFRVHPVIRKIM